MVVLPKKTIAVLKTLVICSTLTSVDSATGILTKIASTN